MAERPLALLVFRYGLVGVLNTLVCVGVMWIGARTGLPYVAYTLFGYVTAIVHSYALNAIFTFSSPLSRKALGLFVGINGSLLLVTQLLQAGLIEIAAAPEVLGVAVAMLFYNVAGFLLNRSVVYRA